MAIVDKILDILGLQVKPPTMKQNLTFKELQQLVEEQAKKRGDYWPKGDIMLQIISEVGELAKATNESRPQKPGEERDVPGEISDIVYALVCLANTSGIDLEEALQRKIGIFEERDKNRFTEK